MIMSNISKPDIYPIARILPFLYNTFNFPMLLGASILERGGKHMSYHLDLQYAYNLFFKEYPDVLDVKQLSEILGVCEKTIIGLLNKQSIRSLKVGRAYRIPKLYLLQYLGIINSSEMLECKK